MSSAPLRTRVYVIVHYSGDGDRRILLGREAVLHGAALGDMRSELGASTAAAERQRADFLAQLKARKPTIYPDGALRVKGPWKRGRNFGGVLLIGRASLAGGQIEKNESEKAGGLRECVEELRLPTELLTSGDAAQLLEFVSEELTASTSFTKAELRRYYSLDLDRLVDLFPSLAEELKPLSIVQSFNERLAGGHDGLEKAELLDLALDECIEQLEGGLDEEEGVVMTQQLTLLVTEVTQIIGGTRQNGLTLLKELRRFQEARSIAAQLNALKEFRKLNST